MHVFFYLSAWRCFQLTIFHNVNKQPHFDCIFSHIYAFQIVKPNFFWISHIFIGLSSGLFISEFLLAKCLYFLYYYACYMSRPPHTTSILKIIIKYFLSRFPFSLVGPRIFYPLAQQPNAGQARFIIDVSISHTMTLQSVVLL